MERPDDQSHYRNYSPEPALEVLRRIAHTYRSLATIPRRYECSLSRWDRKKVNFFFFLSPDCDPSIHLVIQYSSYWCSDKSPQHPDLKRILIEDYGWPDNFKKDAWAEDHERIWYELDHRFEVENSKI